MNENRKYGILEADIQRIVSIFRANPNINELILFGSRAKGNFDQGSDIDLVIKGQALKLNDILKAKLEVDKLLLPYKFDIVIYNRIKEKALLNHIDRVGVKLYSRKSSLD